MLRFLSTFVAAFAAAATIFAASATSVSAAAGRAFTPRDLIMLDRLSDPRLSPDGRTVLYDVRTTDFASNRGRHSLWELDLKTKRTSRLPISEKGANSARWSADGRFIYFLSPRSGSTQLWRSGKTGEAPLQVTNLPQEVQAFRIAPDGVHAVVALAVFPDCPTPECSATRCAMEKTKATGRLYDRLFVRHWDTWADRTKNHLFALTISRSGRASNAVSLMTNVDGDVPNKPFGDENDYAISPDSRYVVYSVRIAGKSEPWSTNFDLYRVPIDASSKPANLTASNPAWDASPAFSHDGTKLAYRAQKRPGFESDRFGIMVMNLKTGSIRELDPSWDRSASDLVWSKDDRTLYATADDTQDHKLFALDATSGDVRALTGAGAVESYDPGEASIVFSQSSLHSPAQLFAIPATGGTAVALVNPNAAKLTGVALSVPERFTFSGWNGDTVHGWVTKPYGYVEGRRYPVAFLIHGGPQGSWDNGWSYRWNPQTYAGHGYAVVQIDPHASTGYGQAFVDAVSQHWGDRPLEDLQKGWAAALARYSFLNGDRACALGASYGGYMVYWIAGNWNAPWKCLVDHDGVFDNRIMGYATEELWFSEWENGGTPWDHAAQYEQFNPVDHVADWRVPMLVIHSELDYRIPVDQGIGAFTALQRRGIPSEFLSFPDENHWVLKPQNSLQWHDTVNAWLDRWTR